MAALSTNLASLSRPLCHVEGAGQREASGLGVWPLVTGAHHNTAGICTSPPSRRIKTEQFCLMLGDQPMLLVQTHDKGTEEVGLACRQVRLH